MPVVPTARALEGDSLIGYKIQYHEPDNKKEAQEKLIKESSLPYSIIHATQFFEFVKGIADFSTQRNQVHHRDLFVQSHAIRAGDRNAAQLELTDDLAAERLAAGQQDHDVARRNGIFMAR